MLGFILLLGYFFLVIIPAAILWVWSMINDSQQ